MSLLFTKMQGLGNDFVLIDATKTPLTLKKQQIKRIANRHYGVGCDQLLLIGPPPPHAPNVDFSYRIYNADGSEVSQCGNGARCVARYLFKAGKVTSPRIVIATHSSVLTLQVKENQVSVDMGEPKFDPKQIPFVTKQTTPPYHIEIDGCTIPVYVVNFGNPHAIILAKNMPAEWSLTRLGLALNQNPAFPEGVNVGCITLIDQSHIQLQVYERGAGITLACGSGACAAMAVGRQAKLLSHSVTVSQPGGDLQIQWNGPGNTLKMTGEAVFVFSGELFDY